MVEGLQGRCLMCFRGKLLQMVTSSPFIGGSKEKITKEKSLHGLGWSLRQVNEKNPLLDP